LKQPQRKEEHALVEAAFGKLAAELGESLGHDEVDSKAVLLFLAERVLETDSPTDLGGRVEREDSPYTILYHLCPDCRSARVATADGLVEIPAEVVERVEAEAQRVEIDPEEELAGSTSRSSPVSAKPVAMEERPVSTEDRDRPNPPQLTRKVLLRDGRVCSNPLCRRRTGLHAHHIQFRSHGGRTELWNEKIVCQICHSLLHQGLLEIEGDPLRGVRFRPKGAKSSLRDVAEELRSLLNSKSGIPDSKSLSRLGAEESGIPDSHSAGDLIAALRSLGYSPSEARLRVDRATTKLRPSFEDAEVSEEEVLAEALRA